MVEIKGLCKTFRGSDRAALSDVSGTLPTGCICGLCGANGAGKSTLMRVMAGVYHADSGSVFYDGRDVHEKPAIKAEIAFLPETGYFPEGANLNRLAGMYQNAYPARFDKARFDELVDLFRLERKKPLSAYSKGMRRQASLVLALACRPRYLLLDETTDGLDPVVRQLVKTLLCGEVAERETTVVIASHSLRELEDVCDRLMVLNGGCVMLEEDVASLKTTLCKVQAAFEDAAIADALCAELPVLRVQRQGTMVTLLLRGDREELTARIRAHHPLLLDVLSPTLEEVFAYEMEAAGYSFTLPQEEDAP